MTHTDRQADAELVREIDTEMSGVVAPDRRGDLLLRCREALTRQPEGNMVMVPHGFISCVAGVLEEVKKAWLPTESNFDDDVELCLGQCKAMLAAAATAKAVECCSSCGQAINARHFDGCAYGGMTNPYVTQFQCVRIAPQEDGK